MIEWITRLSPDALVVGLLAGLLIGAVAAWAVARRGQARQAHAREVLRSEVAELQTALAVAETRLQEQRQNFVEQKAGLEQAEQRLGEAFERLAGKVFEERSQKLSDLNSKQLDTLLKPLSERLVDFRRTVAETHQEEVAQNRVLAEKLKELVQLNDRLHADAENLTRALTADVKTQGNWGEQQLERLLEMAGLERGREYSTQVSVTTESGTRLQPDLVLHIPGEKSIVMDSKVSLTAWARMQGETDPADRERMLAEHVRSMRAHIKALGEKRYGDIPELNALDFVLMFVPIEGAMIAALHADPGLPAFALENHVALMSPTNLIATTRTVSAVWSIHKQNNHARDIAQRAGLLYDKFVGFVDSLKKVGDRLRQAQDSYDTAFSQLSSGSGNLVRQVQMLSDLGARHAKQLDTSLTEHAAETDTTTGDDPKGLRLVKPDDED